MGNVETTHSKPPQLIWRACLLEQLTESDFNSGWQQRPAYICGWQNRVLMVESFTKNLNSVYAEYMIYHEKNQNIREIARYCSAYL